MAEFGEPAALLNNPNSQFAEMILAAAGVNDQSEDVKALLKVSLSEASVFEESSKTDNKKLNSNERRNSKAESDDSNPVVTISDSSGAAGYDNKAYQSNDSDEEPWDVTAL